MFMTEMPPERFQFLTEDVDTATSRAVLDRQNGAIWVASGRRFCLSLAVRLASAPRPRRVFPYGVGTDGVAHAVIRSLWREAWALQPHVSLSASLARAGGSDPEASRKRRVIG